MGIFPSGALAVTEAAAVEIVAVTAENAEPMEETVEAVEGLAVVLQDPLDLSKFTEPTQRYTLLTWFDIVLFS